MWLSSLNEWKEEGQPCAIVTIIETTGSTPRGIGAKMVVNVDGKIAGTIGGGGVEHACRNAARKAMAANTCLTKTFSLLEGDRVKEGTAKNLAICGGTLRVFIEPVLPRNEVVIFGAGHIGERLGRLCDVLALPHRVYDDRAEYATPERFPNARERIVAPYGQLRSKIELGRQSYCVILTHGHKYDRVCLEQLLAHKAVPYIGMIGSATKVAILFKQLAKNEIRVDQRVYSPVGLKIATQLPGEIALAILAEILLLINGGEPAHFRLPFPTKKGGR